MSRLKRQRLCNIKREELKRRKRARGKEKRGEGAVQRGNITDRQTAGGDWHGASLAGSLTYLIDKICRING